MGPSEGLMNLYLRLLSAVNATCIHLSQDWFQRLSVVKMAMNVHIPQTRRIRSYYSLSWLQSYRILQKLNVHHNIYKHPALFPIER
jgi:hypothetical protein